MCRNPRGLYGSPVLALVSLLVAGPAWQATLAGSDAHQAGQLCIGWAWADLTPQTERVNLFETPACRKGLTQNRLQEFHLNPALRHHQGLQSVACEPVGVHGGEARRRSWKP